MKVSLKQLGSLIPAGLALSQPLPRHLPAKPGFVRSAEIVERSTAEKQMD